MKPLSQLSGPIYDALKGAGLLREVYPEATGEWEKDKAEAPIFAFVPGDITPLLAPSQGCRNNLWCPKCSQIITDSICLCTGHCDKHGHTLVSAAPDGDWAMRQTGREWNEGDAMQRWQGGEKKGFRRRGETWWVLRDPSARSGWREEPH